MNNIKILSFIVACLLFSSINVYAQPERQERPLLTQQIDRGEVVIVAQSTAALVPNLVSTVPLVSTATGSSSCWWPYVSCYRGTSPAAECNCQFWSCSDGWTPGACPNP